MRILAMLTNPLTAVSVLSATTCLAARCAPAEISLLYPRPEVDPDFLPTEDIYTEAHHQKFEASQDRLVQQLVQKVAGWAGPPDLRQVRGKLSTIVNEAAATADLVVLGTPHRDSEANTILATLLFQANKPVLLVPRTMPRDFGQHIAIAWQKECVAAERAVEALNGLLLGAKRTTILIGEHGPGSSSPPAALLHRLSEGGRPAAIRHFPLARRHIGEALLSEARQIGADMLVMGAYGHSRLREFIFGGATTEILRNFNLPVLIHH
ncbi:MAG: universal stress protein [Rhodospirillales bacterium]|nr:universal stress protein [Rhodospirillales bacterium]